MSKKKRVKKSQEIAISLKQLLGSSIAISKILTCPTLDIRISYRLSKIVPLLNDIEGKRIELIKKYGDEDGNGRTEIKDKDKEVLFNKEFDTLLEGEEEVFHIQPLMLDSLKSANLTPADLYAIDYLLDPNSF